MEDDLYGIGPMITHDLPIVREYNAVQQKVINERHGRMTIHAKWITREELLSEYPTMQEWINERLSREMQSGNRVIIGLKDILNVAT